MREALAEYRRAGRSFDFAWQEAWRSIPWAGLSSGKDWRAALEDTREEFRAAYEGEDTMLSVALASRDLWADGFADFIVGTT